MPNVLCDVLLHWQHIFNDLNFNLGVLLSNWKNDTMLFDSGWINEIGKCSLEKESVSYPQWFRIRFRTHWHHSGFWILCDAQSIIMVFCRSEVTCFEIVLSISKLAGCLSILWCKLSYSIKLGSRSEFGYDIKQMPGYEKDILDEYITGEMIGWICEEKTIKLNNLNSRIKVYFENVFSVRLQFAPVVS